jgi:hypothetical protein
MDDLSRRRGRLSTTKYPLQNVHSSSTLHINPPSHVRNMNRAERELVERMYRDCLQLKRRGELTEFGEGQLVLCKLLRRIS